MQSPNYVKNIKPVIRLDINVKSVQSLETNYHGTVNTFKQIY